MKNKTSQLKEARYELNDEKVLTYVKECVKVLSDAGYPATMNDIDCVFSEATKTFGTMSCKRYPSDNYTLTLSKYLSNEPEDVIKNTIYHELCHYLQYKKAFKDGAFYFDWSNRVKARRELWSIYGGHGRIWKDFAYEVGKLTGQDITRTNSYSQHTEVGKAYDDKIKYIVKCTHCGNTFKYTKRTAFINDILNGNGHAEHWWCCCKDGTKCKDFEILKRG